MTNSRIESFKLLPTPFELKHKYPLTTSAEEVVFQGRRALGDCMIGRDRRLVVMTGPCSVHNADQAIEYAHRLCALRDKVEDKIFIIMRTYFEKPRTRRGWKGLIFDPEINGKSDIEKGLSLARKILISISEIGLPVVTEFLDPIIPQYFDDLITTGAIGARTIESQTHRQMASGLSMPIGFKNATSGDIMLAVDALIAAEGRHPFLGIDHDGRVCEVMASGNEDGYIILRGGKNSTNFHREAITETEQFLSKAGSKAKVLIDCSHGNSLKKCENQIVPWNAGLEHYLTKDTSILGMMLESHLYEGSQKIPDDLSDFDNGSLQYGVSITDECISWQQTESMILEAYEKLSR